jgi:hypothetical protein
MLMVSLRDLGVTHMVDCHHMYTNQTRNVNPKTSGIFGGQGRKTGDGGVTSPGIRDVSQLYEYLYSGKYRNW